MKATQFAIIQAHTGVKKLKWSDIYNSETDLVNDLKSITIRTSGTNPTKGYMYLQSFQNQLSSGKNLTDKQMTQLKRLAISIAYEKLNPPTNI